MTAAIQIDSVFLNFGSKAILGGINLTVPGNRVTGILGRNGCGKSCLLKIITGQLQPQSKHISYRGKTIKKLYRQKGLINYLPQHEFHPKSVLVEQLLAFYGVEREPFLQEYPFLLKSLKRRFYTFSGGERRMLEVALVLESKTRFSILDEPFTHLMPKYVELIKERIAKLKCQKGILVTDHQYQNVMAVADELYLMSEGVMRRVEELEDLRRQGYIR